MNRYIIGSAALLLLCGAVSSGNAAPAKNGALVREPFCDSLLVQLLKFVPDSIRHSTIAVVPFVNKTGDQALSYGASIGEYFLGVLKTHSRFVPLDRVLFKQTLRNMDLPLKNITDDSTAIEIARKSNAAFLLAGAISIGEKGTYAVDGRIIDTKTGIIVSGAQVQASLREIAQLSFDMDLQRERAAIMPAVLRSFVPGWGQAYRQRWVVGGIAVSAFVAAGVATGYLAVMDLKARKAWDDWDEYYLTRQWRKDIQDEARATGVDSAVIFDRKEAEGERLNADYLKKKDRLNLGIAATVGIWALNIADVSIAGAVQKSRIRLYYSGDPARAAIALGLEF
jgi:TolB-like protein